MRQKRSAHAPTAQDTAGNQQARELMVAASSLLLPADSFLALAFVTLIFRFAPLAQQMRKNGAAHTAAAQDAAGNQHARKLMVAASSLLLAGSFLTFVSLVLRFAPLFQQMCENGAAHTAAAQD